MKLPAKVIYACRAITELALHYRENKPMQIKAISDAQDIPKKFLVQLFIRLKNAGIVNSTRGTTGGYSLSIRPSSLSVADVVRAVDDNIIAKNPNSQLGAKEDIGRIFGRLWNDINEDIIKKLEEVKFDSIVAKITSEQFTYQI